MVFEGATDVKYPLHTVSKPVTGEEARKLIEAVDNGGCVGNERSIAVAKEIAAEWKAKLAADGKAVRRR
jgi:hypothetical protein